MKNMRTSVNYILIIFVIWGFSSSADPCPENYVCTSLLECYVEEEFVFPCDDSKNNTGACCPRRASIQRKHTTSVSRGTVFPEECGASVPGDRISEGKKAYSGQFPWMALLGYQLEGLPLTQFLCGGTIISDSHILTAAHCFQDANFQLKFVRVGELDLSSEIDCENITNQIVCAPPHVDIKVEKVIVHDNFNKSSLSHDIAIIKLQDKINFTGFVQPICLPFNQDVRPEKLFGKQLIVSGWGKTQSVNVGGSSYLQYTGVSLWNSTDCNRLLPPSQRPIRSYQVCANGKKKEDACEGDSGGPLTYPLPGEDGEARTYQLGIVSFSSTHVCGNPELPTVYLRVDNYLDWIRRIVNET